MRQLWDLERRRSDPKLFWLDAQTQTGFQHFPSDGMRFLRARGHPVSERVLVFDLPVVLILFLSFPIRAPDYDMESAYQTGIALILDLSQQFFFVFLSKSDEVRI